MKIFNLNIENKIAKSLIIFLLVLSIGIVIFFVVKIIIDKNKSDNIPETTNAPLEKISSDIRNIITTDEVFNIYDEYYNTLPEDINNILYIKPTFSETLLSKITPYQETITFRPFLYEFKKHTFTNAGATGSIGPTLEQVRSAYNNITWKNQYINMVNNDGIQIWTVPRNGYYKINAIGAGGGGSNLFGKGRDVELLTYLKMNEVIKILVGQKGSIFKNNQGSGGGGTFVLKSDDTPIIIAGGGGGSGSTNEDINSNASLSINGNDGAGDNQNTDTLFGEGGNYGNGGINSFYAGGGGGIIGNGGSSINAYGGFSFSNGGKGGIKDTINGSGGFGGGGNCIDGFGGGGGGGFSGGGGGGKDDKLGWLGGGGGGSGHSGIYYSNIISLPINTENMSNYRGKSDIFSIIIKGKKNNNSDIWGTDIYTDNSNIVNAAMHSGIISDKETKKVYIEMLPGQQYYPSLTKNSITSNSYANFNGSYKFISSPYKQLNTSIGDITPLIDNGPENKDHGKVIITFISETFPKKLENYFDIKEQEKKIDFENKIEIYMINEKTINLIIKMLELYQIEKNKKKIEWFIADETKLKADTEASEALKLSENSLKELLRTTDISAKESAKLANLLTLKYNLELKETELRRLAMNTTEQIKNTAITISENAKTFAKNSLSEVLRLSNIAAKSTLNLINSLKEKLRLDEIAVEAKKLSMIAAEGIKNTAETISENAKILAKNMSMEVLRLANFSKEATLNLINFLKEKLKVDEIFRDGRKFYMNSTIEAEKNAKNILYAAQNLSKNLNELAINAYNNSIEAGKRLINAIEEGAKQLAAAVAAVAAAAARPVVRPVQSAVQSIGNFFSSRFR
jgi:hypothetical protein